MLQIKNLSLVFLLFFSQVHTSENSKNSKIVTGCISSITLAFGLGLYGVYKTTQRVHLNEQKKFLVDYCEAKQESDEKYKDFFAQKENLEGLLEKSSDELAKYNGNNSLQKIDDAIKKNREHSESYQEEITRLEKAIPTLTDDPWSMQKEVVAYSLGIVALFIGIVGQAGIQK